MDETHITSHNQSGGITAGSVQVESQRRSKRTGWKRFKHWAVVIGVIAALATIAGFVWNMLGKERTGQMDKNENQQGLTNVTSFNQSGGITAHTVNVGQHPRKLDENLKLQLDNLTLGKTHLSVTAVMGDGEVFQFATEVFNYLRTKDVRVDGVNQSVFTQPVKGQLVKPLPDGGLEMIIGTKD